MLIRAKPLVGAVDIGVSDGTAGVFINGLVVLVVIGRGVSVAFFGVGEKVAEGINVADGISVSVAVGLGVLVGPGVFVGGVLIIPIACAATITDTQHRHSMITHPHAVSIFMRLLELRQKARTRLSGFIAHTFQANETPRQVHRGVMI